MSDIKTQDLYRPNVVAICGVRHPLVPRRSLRWDDLYDHPWILPEAGIAMRSAVKAHFRKQKRRPIRALVESSSIQANVALLNTSQLIWVLSLDVAKYFAELDALHILKVEPLLPPGAFVLAQLNGRVLSPAAQKLADCLRTAGRH